MIFGYVLIAPNGIPIHFKIFPEMIQEENVFKEPDFELVVLFSSGLNAIQSFFKTLFGIELDEFIGGEIKMSRYSFEDYMFVTITDLNDAMARTIARKFLPNIVSRISESNISSSSSSSHLEDLLKDIIEQVDEEIKNLNQKYQGTKYI